MKLNAVRYSAFVLLWLCYCLLYFTRKPLGLIKTDLSTKYGYSKLTIGILDTALLLPYALFQIIFGNLGDSINPTRFLSACVIGAGLSTMFLGPVDKLWFIVISLFFSGTFQAFCWPLMVKIVSILFTGSKNQNFVLGVFGTSAFAGGTLGTLLAVFIKDRLTWRWVYPIPSVIVSLTGLALLFFYKCSFKKVINVPSISRDDTENGRAAGDEKCAQTPTSTKKRSKLAIFSHIKGSIVLLWRVPLVFHLAVSNFSLKMIRYMLYMWLPYMLEHKNNFSSTKAGNISAVFEVGGVIGSIVIGLIIDKCFSRSQFKGVIFIILCQICAMASFIFTTSPSLHWLINTAALLFVGIFIGGLDTLFSSSIPLLVTSCFKVDASSAVVGLVNGIGTLGTFLEGPLVGLVLHMTSPPATTRLGPNSTLEGGVMPGAALNGTQVAGGDNGGGDHHADINFTGLFWIIGVLSFVPAIFLTAGFLRFRKVLNAYCIERLILADEMAKEDGTANGVKKSKKKSSKIDRFSSKTGTPVSNTGSVERALLQNPPAADLAIEGEEMANGVVESREMDGLGKGSADNFYEGSNIDDVSGASKKLTQDPNGTINKAGETIRLTTGGDVIA